MGDRATLSSRLGVRDASFLDAKNFEERHEDVGQRVRIWQCPQPTIYALRVTDVNTNPQNFTYC